MDAGEIVKKILCLIIGHLDHGLSRCLLHIEWEAPRGQVQGAVKLG